jgi:hypothetical protein
MEYFPFIPIKRLQTWKIGDYFFHVCISISDIMEMKEKY